MKRSAPLKRGKPLKRTPFVTSPKAKARKARRDRAWTAAKKERYEQTGGRCEGIGGEGNPERHAPGCNRWADDGHHIKARRFRDDTVSNCRLLSRPCHDYVELNRSEGYALGLLRKGNSNG